MPQPLIELNDKSGAPVLHLALANGFVPQTYLPLLRPFMADYRVVCLPPRALWGAGDPPALDTTADDWQMLADDLLAGFDHYGLDGVVAVGHSFGGVASLLAALAQPERFKALILLDPTILSPQRLAWMQQARAEGSIAQLPLIQGAQRRRNAFESLEAAYERFRQKQHFAQWSDEVVRLYVEHGTVANADGTRRLAWSPAWEAYYYATGYTRIWEVVPQLAHCPVPMLVINGSDSDTFEPPSVARMKREVPNATYHTIDGHGHLFPQSAPAATATRIAAWLAQGD